MKKNAPLPLYLRIADDLRAKLLLLPDGAPFETEQALAETYGAARGTIRQALNVLVQEGLLLRTQGSGSFRSQPLNSLYRFTLSQELSDAIREIGTKSSLQHLSVTVVPASTDVADLLGIPHGEKVRKVSRVRSINGKPYACCIGYLRTDEIPQFYKRDYTSTLSELIRIKMKIQIKKRRCDFRAVAADETVSDLLELPLGSPVLEIRVMCTGSDDQPLLSDSFYFPAAQSLHFEI